MTYFTPYNRPYFEMDNTEGFTQDQLDYLNTLACEQITEDMDSETIQYITSKILENAITTNKESQMRTTLHALKNELNVELNTKASDAVSEMLSHTDKVTAIVLKMGKVTGHYNDCTITLSEAFTQYISLAKQLHAESADSPLGFMQLAYEALLDDTEKLEAFIASLN